MAAVLPSSSEALGLIQKQWVRDFASLRDVETSSSVQDSNFSTTTLKTFHLDCGQSVNSVTTVYSDASCAREDLPRMYHTSEDSRDPS